MLFDYFKLSLFTSFPEMIMVILLGFQLANVKYPPMPRILLTSFVQALVAFCIMISSFNTAINFIIQLTSMIILVSYILDSKLFKAPIIVLVGVLLQGIIQSIILPIINKIWEIPISNLTNNFQAAITCFIPVFMTSVLLLIIFKKKNFYLLDISN